MVRNSIGAITEGIDIRRSGPVKFNLVFSITKKIIFMGSLVLMYPNPIIQTISISALHFVYMIFLLYW
jgi:hypothetical protein